MGVMLYYDGEWTSDSNYINHSAIGIRVSMNSTFDRLVELICEELGIDKQENIATLKYKFENRGEFVKINSDKTLDFYLHEKIAEKGIGIYPIYVDTSATNNARGNNRFELGDGTVNCTTNELVPSGATGSASTFTAALPSLTELGTQMCNIPTLEAEDNAYDTLGIVTEIDSRKVEVGIVFKSKEILILCLSMRAIKVSFQYHVEKSESTEYRIKCFGNDCKWSLRASGIKNTELFKIRRISNNHTCSADQLCGKHRNATCKLVAHCVRFKFVRSRTIYTPLDIQNDMLKVHGVRISYSKVWRAREKALQMIRGDPTESYQNLPSYLHMLTVINPGTRTRIKADECDRFLYCYVALGASINGWPHCRPVIVIDATYLRGCYGGALFTACTQDANGNIFILAFDVGDNENDNSWGWFLEQLKDSYPEREGLRIVSDRHRSIENVAQIVYPNAKHVACSFHLLKNIKLTFGKDAKGVREPFNAAVRAYTITKFETHMERIDKIHDEIRPYLVQAGYDRWSRAHSKVNRYSTMTSNIVESVNAATKAAKNFPIEALIELLHGLVQTWIYKNSKVANSIFTYLCRKYELMVMDNMQESRRLQVIPSSFNVDQVNDETTSHVVCLEEKSCTCRRFDVDEIPCPPAMAVVSVNNLSVYDYCSPYLGVKRYRDAYTRDVYPMGNKENWVVPDEVNMRRVLPPSPKRRPGRPKQNRIKSAVEGKTVPRCSHCGDRGHNMSKCRNPIPIKSRKRKNKERANPKKKKREQQLGLEIH